MVISLAAAWRIAFAIGLCIAIFLSICARAPSRSVPSWELRRLMCCAVTLYAVGVFAKLTDHGLLAGLVFSGGIMLSTLAAWLSRGRDQEDPPDGDQPVDQRPPPEPDGMPPMDWPAFEREFRRYERGLRSRTPA
jgi:hypothetical protein